MARGSIGPRTKESAAMDTNTNVEMMLTSIDDEALACVSGGVDASASLAGSVCAGLGLTVGLLGDLLNVHLGAGARASGSLSGSLSI